MDSTEATKVVINKISQLEPDHIARKIIGFMFFQELSDQEMIRLALGPDSLIHNLIQRAKTSHVISPPPATVPDPSFPFPRYSTRPFPSQAAFGRMDHYWDHHSPVEQQKLGFKIVPDYEEQLEAGFSSRGGRNSPVKTCHYFIQGFCKHGSNCRYYHDESARESYLLHNLGPNHNPNPEDEPGYSPGSLENLELEIVELLKSRRGFPVSIASLPMMYYEAYGKTLQAEGYLTESQRHGKAGYSLTKLLARLKNSIRLIDRPHGQHSVILSEDFAKYMEFRAERNDPGPVVTGSRQIYLTFPADSTFTEEDVSNYFNNFGIVNDVRIPSQQKRMFGFVTFASADTVRLILNKGNPHFVCNARVLVKPYREKSKLVERKYLEKFDHPGYYHSHPTHFDSSELHNNIHLGCGFHLLMAGWELTRQARMQLLDEHENAVELEAMRLSQLQLAGKPMASRPWLSYSTNELNMIQDRSKFSSSGRVNHLLDVLHNGSPSDDNSMYPVTSWGDQESGQGMSLPDSPFAPPAPSSIPAVI